MRHYCHLPEIADHHAKVKEKETMRLNSSVAVLAIAALLVAGCGGSSSSPGVAHLSASTSTNAEAASGGALPRRKAARALPAEDGRLRAVHALPRRA